VRIDKPIEKFKEELKKAVNNIDTLVFLLEGGANVRPEPVSRILERYDSIPHDIQNAFCDLNKNAGDAIVYKSDNATANFTEQRVSELNKNIRLLKGGRYVSRQDKEIVKVDPA
jgi:hypothetical protein